MPKIIKDAEYNIFISATELFSKYGYQNVDMKMIAKKSNIAVGTLYNYYKNKEDLYLTILNESWSDTFSKLDSIINLPLSCDKKLSRFIKIIYEDIEKRKELGITLIKCSTGISKESDKLIVLKNEILQTLISIFASLFPNKENDLYERICETILVITYLFVQKHFDNKEKNLLYTKNIALSFLI